MDKDMSPEARRREELGRASFHGWRVTVHVKYEDRHAIKRLGMLWNPTKRYWYQGFFLRERADACMAALRALRHTPLIEEAWIPKATNFRKGSGMRTAAGLNHQLHGSVKPPAEPTPDRTPIAADVHVAASRAPAAPSAPPAAVALDSMAWHPSRPSVPFELRDLTAGRRRS